MEERRNAQGQTEREFLAAYDAGRYPRPSVTVDSVLFTILREEEAGPRKKPRARDLKVLLVRRQDHPFIGAWALPGGFVNINESLDAAAARELQEETGIQNIYLEQLYTYGDVARDPRTRVISCAYLSLVDATALSLQAGDDAADARWFTVRDTVLHENKTMTAGGYTQEWSIRVDLSAGEEHLWATLAVVRQVEGNVVHTRHELLESHGLGFDHGKAIHYGLERLRNKIEYTDIAFSLLPPFFTLSELQQIYEVILGKELLVAAFRRKIAPMVLESNQTKMEGAHRPAKLYRFNADWAVTRF